MVGHVHLTVNVYEDLTEVIASMGMNIIVATGFWLDWKQNKNNLK
jgi:predicted metal-dependent phosphotriesterase family hydrolase